MDRQITSSDYRKLDGIDVIILCGGQGTRLQPILPDKPKILAPLGEKTLLDILLEKLSDFGFRRIILSVGHLKDQIIEHCSRNKKRQVEFSSEEAPLGTGGALKLAAPRIQSEHFLVMNGDSLCPVDFQALHDFHIQKKSLLTLVIAPNSTRGDAEGVELNPNSEVIGFLERTDTPHPFISAGIYLMHKDIFSHMPAQESFSLERDLFPCLAGSNCYGFKAQGEVLDIGTPERYRKAGAALREIFKSND